MPIRHCQKCGLKVLIDESQSTANPFYCQRCSASLKAAERGGGGDAPPGAAKGGPIKVLCPYCKASFTGRLPGKPAKGQCPICRKELVLLPTGEIKPGATFDLGKWQQDNEAARERGATPMPRGSTKIKLKAAEAAAVDETAVRTETPSEMNEAVGAPVANPLAEDSAVITNMEPTAPLPEPAPVMDDPAEAPPQPAEEPAPGPARRPLGKTRPERTAGPAIVEATGSGKVFLAIVLFLLPLIGAGVFYGLREGALQTLLVKIGGIGQRGLYKIYQKLNPPPPPKEEKPKEEPKVEETKEEEKPKVDPHQQEKDRQAVIDAYMKHRRADRDLDQRLKGETEAWKNSDAYKQIKADVDAKEKAYKELLETYNKTYNTTLDPTKE